MKNRGTDAPHFKYRGGKAILRRTNLLRKHGKISMREWKNLIPKHWKPATIRTQFRALGLFPNHYFDGKTVYCIHKKPSYGFE